MLNRTNRTLSATSTRLNLGTRSFALNANGNIGNETLRLRHAHAAHPASVRVGAVSAYPVPIGKEPIMGTKPMGVAMAMPSGSSPSPMWPLPGRQARVQAQFVADASAFARQADDPQVVGLCREDVVPQRPTPFRVSRPSLAMRQVLSCRLAGRSARDAMVSDATP